MASETPGGNRRQQKIDRRAIRSADEYSRSGQPSAVGGTEEAYAAARAKQPAAKRVDRSTPRSADEYYANPKPVKVAGTRQATKPVPVSRAKGIAVTGAPLLVTTPDELESVLSHLASYMPTSQGGVLVRVLTPLVKSLRARLDNLVVRGLLTEEERARIKIAAGELQAPDKAAPVAAATLPPIDPAAVPPRIAEPPVGDPEAFLAAGGETTAPAVSPEAGPVNVVDEDSDLPASFLQPTTPPASEPSTAEAKDAEAPKS